MKKLWLSLLLPLGVLAQGNTPSIVPEPVSIKTSQGNILISRNTVIRATDAEDIRTANYLSDCLREVYGFQLPVNKSEGRNSIRINTKKFIQAPDKDAYQLTIDKNGVSIDGDTYAGTFYGVQSFMQLFPQSRRGPLTRIQVVPINYITITDYPRFKYRGMHLDVSRHFFPASFVKKYIDYLAYHKLNYFHWHLTDDQGWRIEIKKYPRLTTVGAFRNGTIINRYPGDGNDDQRYGGFYTQEEVKEIVAYAASRHITVIPEIEMPGHSSAAIAAYPFLSCFPGEETVFPTASSKASDAQDGKKVQETWGVFDDVYCAGKDSTFDFLQGVMDEIIPLFPSNYIHVGGDECPKANWKRCPNCQARMKKLGLKDEHELQSYFIQRMEKYLNAKGKTIIGWNEILEGGLAPNAIVMSWQGEKGGIEAAKQKHLAIMCPEEFTYLNWSQTKAEDSVTFGRYTPVEKIYGYEPVPKELNADEARYIWGVQANVWSEYIKYPSTVEYNVFPRMSALAEVAWTPKEKKDWSRFEKKLPVIMDRYKLWRAHYSNAHFEINSVVAPATGADGVYWKLASARPSSMISVTDASGKTSLFKDSVLVSRTGKVKATLTSGTTVIDDLVQPFYISKATSKKITLATAPVGSYKGQGAFSLVNGIYSAKGISFPDWLGFTGDLDAVIELGRTSSVSTVKVHLLDQQPSGIYLPSSVEILLSADGKSFRSVGTTSNFVKDTARSGFMTVSFSAASARYVKLVAKNYGKVPAGNPGAGNRTLLFADEILVD